MSLLSDCTAIVRGTSRSNELVSSWNKNSEARGGSCPRSSDRAASFREKTGRRRASVLDDGSGGGRRRALARLTAPALDVRPDRKGLDVPLAAPADGDRPRLHGHALREPHNRDGGDPTSRDLSRRPEARRPDR